LELIPFNKKAELKQVTFSQEEENIHQAILDKGLAVTSIGMGASATNIWFLKINIFGI